MIHLALVIVAVVVIGYFCLFLLSLILNGFEEGPGCGCLTLVIVLVIVAVIVALL